MTGIGQGLYPLWGVSEDHVAAIVAVLLLPAAIWLSLVALRRFARAGGKLEARIIAGYDDASLTKRCAAVLLLVTASVHLALAPAHAADAPALARQFALNGLAYLAVVALLFTVRGWRPVTAALLVVTQIAYLFPLLDGSEEADEIGVLTKLVELTALALVLLPEQGFGATISGRRWSAVVASTLGLGLLTGAVVWATGFEAEAVDAAAHAAGQDGHHHHTGLGLGNGTIVRTLPENPTAAQAEAATRLAIETKAALAKYADPAVARADGYRPTGRLDPSNSHWENPAATKDRRILDPTRPEQLVYAETADGPLLLGAVYIMPRAGEVGPAVGGPLTAWHAHNLCISFLPITIANVVSPYGACPPLSANVVIPEMMHVWTIDNPDGPFAEKLDPVWLKAITGR